MSSASASARCWPTPAEHALGERAEAQVGRVGIGEREQILRVEEARARERRRHEAREEVALELGVVRDDRAARERLEQRGRDRLDRRRVREVGVGEARERRDRARHAPARPDPRLEHAHAAAVEQHRADLDRLGGPLLGQPGGLEVDDRDRPDRREQRRERREIEPELALGLDAHARSNVDRR